MMTAQKSILPYMQRYIICSCNKTISIPFNSKIRFCEACIKARQREGQKISTIKLIVKIKRGQYGK